MTPSRRPTPLVLVRGAGTIGGLLLLAASFVPWSSHGAGSSIALARVGDLVLSGALDTWVPRGAGLVVYAIPLGGALLWLGTGLGRTLGAVIGALGLGLGLLGSGLALLALAEMGRAGLGPGALMAGAGLACGSVAVAASVRDHRGPETA